MNILNSFKRSKLAQQKKSNQPSVIMQSTAYWGQAPEESKGKVAIEDDPFDVVALPSADQKAADDAGYQVYLKRSRLAQPTFGGPGSSPFAAPVPVYQASELPYQPAAAIAPRGRPFEPRKSYGKRSRSDAPTTSSSASDPKVQIDITALVTEPQNPWTKDQIRESRAIETKVDTGVTWSGQKDPITKLRYTLDVRVSTRLPTLPVEAKEGRRLEEISKYLWTIRSIRTFIEEEAKNGRYYRVEETPVLGASDAVYREQYTVVKASPTLRHAYKAIDQPQRIGETLSLPIVVKIDQLTSQSAFKFDPPQQTAAFFMASNEKKIREQRPMEKILPLTDKIRSNPVALQTLEATNIGIAARNSKRVADINAASAKMDLAEAELEAAKSFVPSELKFTTSMSLSKPVLTASMGLLKEMKNLGLSLPVGWYANLNLEIDPSASSIHRRRLEKKDIEELSQLYATDREVMALLEETAVQIFKFGIISDGQLPISDEVNLTLSNLLLKKQKQVLSSASRFVFNTVEKIPTIDIIGSDSDLRARISSSDTRASSSAASSRSRAPAQEAAASRERAQEVADTSARASRAAAAVTSSALASSPVRPSSFAMVAGSGGMVVPGSFLL
jgi:hypothetical protein